MKYYTKIWIFAPVHRDQCSIDGCNQGFARRDNFRYHMNKHNGLKPYVCKFDGCQQKFSSPAFRSIHGRTCQFKPVAIV